ncbi:MAG: HTH domain-containing protein [Leadbetterella sp.]|nr:HTH domain-containing protein [Leadbetterella sp.]
MTNLADKFNISARTIYRDIDVLPKRGVDLINKRRLGEF